ncbi:MAG: UDP-4-amino-4,6-dideoxy-N-acetyl-beta-L-altrosamine transaminase [Dissulfurispiraceae bacterium]
MTDVFPYSRQSIGADDIEAVIAVLKSDYLTQGPAVEMFERKLSEYVNARYAVVMSSGTAALHAAYFAAGIEAGGEVITSPITFAATSNAALMLGIKPVFVDVERDSGNMDTALLEPLINSATKAIVPIHYAGHPVDMPAVHAVAQRHGLVVIEDACHAISAEYRLQPAQGESAEGSDNDWIRIGSCTHSDITVFSFHPVKPMTTGEGGAVLTNDPEIYTRLKQFRTHGITKDNFVNESHGDWYYEMQFLGNNYRMTDIQAALGTSQLKKLDGFSERRREIALRYDEAFRGNPYFDIPVRRSYARSSHHLYPIRLRDSYKKNKRVIFSRLKEKGLGVQVHYIPVYLQPYYKNLGFKQGLCPLAEDFYEREISIPLYQGMSDADADKVAHRLLSVFNEL